jgi:hypothetical protein
MLIILTIVTILAIVSLLCVWSVGIWILFTMTSTLADERNSGDLLEMQSMPMFQTNTSMEGRVN